MQFQVPQFIETEDKIIGPLTLKQFLYIAAGTGLIFIMFFTLNIWLWLFFSFFVAVFSAALAFVKVNGRPLPIVLAAAFEFYWKPKLFLWKKAEIREAEKEFKIPSVPEKKPSLLENLQQQLSTTKIPVPKREKILGSSILDKIKSTKERFETIKRITGERETARRVDYR
ncbi:MAG: PrgI family protein [Candidatus Pacebacteria bacterium]|nr:PrgI family protein [Candidatus Paceibacterota bacterium]